jgi:hypothetical protein
MSIEIGVAGILLFLLIIAIAAALGGIAAQIMVAAMFVGTGSALGAAVLAQLRPRRSGR